METLVREYERPVFNAALRMLGDRDDAADVTQNTFMKALQNLGQFNPGFRFFSWIYRIAINESIDLLKRRSRTETIADSVPGNEPTPEHQADSDQVGAEVQSAMMELSEDYRSVIVLKYFTGCSYREMAQILRIPEKTVKSRLFTARQQMRTTLQNHGVLRS